MADLILIRHSISQQQPGISAHQWTLTPEGRARCIALAQHLYPYALAHIYTSAEPKARLTGELVAQFLGGLSCNIEEDLHETKRDTAPYHAEVAQFQAAIREAMAHPDELRYGEETFTAARERFGAAVNRLVALHRGQSIALVSHGTVMALYLAQLAQRDVYDIWQQMGMPAYARLSLPDLQLVELVNEIKPEEDD
jgi:broad specificity phosphatase PhoE